MWQYPLGPCYINFFETISILAGDHLVVPTVGEKNKEQTNNRGLGQVQVQEEELCNTEFPVHT